MNLSEFKAWLDGFSEAIGDAPTPDQWAKIKAKLADTVALTVTAPTPTFRGPFTLTNLDAIARNSSGLDLGKIVFAKPAAVDLSQFESLLPGAGSC